MKLTPKPIYEGLNRLSVAHLLVAIVALFVIMPFVNQFPYGNLVESIAFSIVMITAVNAVGGQRRSLAVAVALVAPALVVRWLHHFWPDLVSQNLYLAVALIFVAYILAHLFRFVISAPLVNIDVLCAAISIFLLYAAAWAFLYTIYTSYHPQSFQFASTLGPNAKLSGFTALYFSVQIVSTMTFGDIQPASNVARMMCLVEAVTGVFYMAIMIARLVGVYTSQGPRSGPST